MTNELNLLCRYFYFPSWSFLCSNMSKHLWCLKQASIAHIVLKNIIIRSTKWML